MGLKSRTPPRPPIPEFIVRAAAAEGVSPEELEDRMAPSPAASTTVTLASVSSALGGDAGRPQNVSFEDDVMAPLPRDELYLATHRALRKVPRISAVWDFVVERAEASADALAQL